MNICHFDAQQHLKRVLALYQRAIRALDDALYSPRERHAWESWGQDPKRTGQLLAQGITLLGVNDGQLMGFAQLWPRNCINMLYLDPAFGRQGVATGLVARMEAEARLAGVVWLNTRASKASRPLFQRLGFVVRQQEWVRAQGVNLARAHMVKRLLWC